MLASSRPILSCAEARTLEAGLFGADEAREWTAMTAAGRAIAEAVLDDFREIGGFPSDGRILALVGKGHNGGDALIATRTILAAFPLGRAEVRFVFGERALRPLAARAWRELQQAGAGRVATAADLPGHRLDLCLDGVFGFQFRPPAAEPVAALLRDVNAADIRFRAAVDLPSAGVFRADFTYATGSVKEPAVDAAGAGRVRYLDLGFFAAGAPGANRVLLPSILAPLAALRDARGDKRSYGHLFVIGGSRSFPGAVLMTVLGAIRSGVGLLTAFVPESLVPAYAARAPEAMWVGWPETPEGGLALEGEHRLRTRLGRATALVIGPGIGREPETLALAQSAVAHSAIPVVIDADALQPPIVRAGTASRIVTPHAGEFSRMAEGAELKEFAATAGVTVVLKGPVTRIAGDAAHTKDTSVYHSFFGGPVLARGGSGDVLAGMIGGLLAQTPADPLLAAARGVVWHGMAADELARANGQVAVGTTQLLDFLPAALRRAATGHSTGAACRLRQAFGAPCRDAASESAGRRRGEQGDPPFK